jgi:hypothetical protein
MTCSGYRDHTAVLFTKLELLTVKHVDWVPCPVCEVQGRRLRQFARSIMMSSSLAFHLIFLFRHALLRAKSLRRIHFMHNPVWKKSGLHA